MRALLSLVEQTVPTPLIVINNAEAPDSMPQPFEDSSAELRRAMAETFDALVEGGASRADAARTLLSMEPFNLFPDLVAAFLEEVSASVEKQPRSGRVA